jgi:hypothetical protein
MAGWVAGADAQVDAVCSVVSTVAVATADWDVTQAAAVTVGVAVTEVAADFVAAVDMEGVVEVAR